MQDEHYHEKENGHNVAYRHCCYYLVQTNETINIDMSVYILLKGQFTSSIFVLSFLSAFVSSILF
jgi:hypothetical protein